MCDVDVKWPAAFPGLKALDQLLRCGICYEYLKTAMITECSHNYCSVCIRKSLQYRTRCPSCFEETVETHLRNNRVLDEIVRIFVELKIDLVHCIRVSEYRQSVAQKIGNCAPSKSAVAPGTPLRETVCRTPRDTPEPVRSPVIQSRNRLAQNVATKNLNLEFNNCAKSSVEDKVLLPSTSSAVETIVLSDDSCRDEELTARKDVHIPSIFSPKKVAKQKVPGKKLPCPVCAVEVPEVHINQHLDACLKEPLKQKNVVKRMPLPKLVYNLMKEKQLRQKLKEAGLSTQGDYKTLVQRHSRFTLLYNAECDALHPKPVSEIIQRVEQEEKEEKGSHGSAKSSLGLKLLVDKKNDSKAIDEARTKYLQENKEIFNRLILSLKQRETKKSFSSAAPKKVPSESSSDTEDITTSRCSTVFPTRDSNPDSPDVVETSELHDDDDSMFDHSTAAYCAEVELASYGTTSPVDRLQTTTMPVTNETDKDDDNSSNESFSLLENFDSDSMLDSRMQENEERTLAWNGNVDSDDEDSAGVNSSLVGLSKSRRVLDSQLEDPSYAPDTQDMLDLSDSDEPVVRHLRNSRLGPSGNRTGVEKSAKLKKSRKMPVSKGKAVSTESVIATDFVRGGNKGYIPNGRQGSSKCAQIDGHDEHRDRSTGSASNICTRGKRKMSVECGGEEHLSKSPNSEEFVSCHQKDGVKIKFSGGQHSYKRNVRLRTKL